MLFVNLNGVKLEVYTREETEKYTQIAGHPGSDQVSDFFISFDYPFDDLFLRDDLKVSDLYQAMGYKVFDYAFPQTWADSDHGQAIMKKHGYIPGKTGYPALIWVYEGPGDRKDFFGRPVFQADILHSLGRLLERLRREEKMTEIIFDWLDPDFDPDLFDTEIYLKGRDHKGQVLEDLPVISEVA
jgi:hypothetical protein